MNFDLFDEPLDSVGVCPQDKIRKLGDDIMLLPQFATPYAEELVEDIMQIQRESPFRHMNTPSGYRMSVAMTNCGDVGWVSDQQGYAYREIDPLTQKSWPALPSLFKTVASLASHAAGFADFHPDVCLINRYARGAKMSLHQDKDEKNVFAPIVSISLGLPATFLWGGKTRQDKAQRIELAHGDVLVWGGQSRLNFHGVLPVRLAKHSCVHHHELLNECRINLTLRLAR